MFYMLYVTLSVSLSRQSKTLANRTIFWDNYVNTMAPDVQATLCRQGINRHGVQMQYKHPLALFQVRQLRGIVGESSCPL